jgi:hypothetical protein
MSSKKQTAVEWLVDAIFNEVDLKDAILKLAIQQAKALEKEQIIDAYKQCENSHVSWECDGSQDYYTSTYGQ